MYDLCVVFLQFSKQQRIDFLRNIRPQQCVIIQHVAYNILLNSNLDLSVEDRTYLRRHVSSIRRLASSTICTIEKRTILVKKAPVVYRLMKIAHSYVEREQNSKTHDDGDDDDGSDDDADDDDDK